MSDLFAWLAARSVSAQTHRPCNNIDNSTAVSGPLRIYKSSGCDRADLGGDVAGSIVMVNRGSCAFTKKVFNAQQKGAYAAAVAAGMSIAVASTGGLRCAAAVKSASSRAAV